MEMCGAAAVMWAALAGLATAPSPAGRSAPEGKADTREAVHEETGCIISPLREVVVSSQVSGVIVELPVDEQDRVRAGQILARLDDTLARLTVERLRLVASEKHSLAEARIRLEQAQADYQRDSTLYAKGALASADFEASRRKFELAQVVLQRVQYQKALAAIELKQAEKRLAQHTIRAPIDAVVLTRHRQVGEAVDADAQTPIFTLIDVSRLRARTMVPVEKIERIHLGQRATITPEVIPVTLEGKVAVIRPMVSAKVNRFEVKVEFRDPTGRVRPGMRATVRIYADE